MNQIFPLLCAIMEWVLHPIVTATTMKKLGIMATGGDVQTVVTTATKGIAFLVLYIAFAATV